MEVVGSFETQLNTYHTARPHIPEDSNLGNGNYPPPVFAAQVRDPVS
jgi:hypothetical protein